MTAVDYRAVRFGEVGFLDSDGLTDELAGAELLDRARAAAAGLTHLGVGFGDRVVIVAPTGPDYLSVLLGCLLAGIVPATVSAPAKPADAASSGVRHLHAAIAVIEPAAVLTPDTRLAPALPDGVPLLTFDALRGHGRVPRHALPAPDPDQPHHIQLTSGSTSTPKAAVLSHASVAANTHALQVAMDLVPGRDRVTSWLPLYHDMGLMLMLTGLTSGVAVDLMPPTAFVRDPLSWPRHMSSRGTTVTAAPPFAYRVAADRCVARGAAGIDLSGLRQAYVGAEPIAVSVLRDFQAAFGPHGLAEDVLVPCYGMAETVVATTLCYHKNATTDTSFGRVRWLPLSSEALDGQPPRAVVSCGSPVDGMSLRITTADGRDAAEGEIGAIHVHGSSVMAGYLTTEGFFPPPSGWHDTGDLGLLVDGELYVVGRTKEMLIVRGRNLPPYDIEAVIEEHPLVKAGGCAVFSHHDDTTSTEQVVAVVETREKPAALPAIRDELATAVRQVFGLSLSDVVFVARGGIPRTTSGKRRRRTVRDDYLTGRLTG